MEYNIAKQYTETPGPRFIKQGDFSGEDFRKNILVPIFNLCVKNKEKLTITLDGGYGYPTSFLEESFGGLSREFGSESVLNTIDFISDEEPGLIEEITNYIVKANK